MLDLNTLAEETLKLGKKISADQSSPSFDSHYFNDLSHLEETISFFEEDDEVLSEGPGVVFVVEKGVNTFCFRGIPTDDMKEAVESVQQGDKNHLKLLRIKEQTPSDHPVLTFPTATIAEAEVIVDQMMNRRLPIFEEVLCNISDPGFSWWMDDNEGHFQIFFQSHGIERAENFVRLGPLGDSQITFRRLSQVIPLLKKEFSIREVSLSDKSFSISSVDIASDQFSRFKGLFLDGQTSLKEEVFKDTTEGRTLYLFFNEIALLRRFWLKAYELVQTEVPSRH